MFLWFFRFSAFFGLKFFPVFVSRCHSHHSHDTLSFFVSFSHWRGPKVAQRCELPSLPRGDHIATPLEVRRWGLHRRFFAGNPEV